MKICNIKRTLTTNVRVESVLNSKINVGCILMVILSCKRLEVPS